MKAARSIRFAIGVCDQIPPRQALELAADMARLLSAQMTALMIEDGATEAMASLPFAREFVVGRSAWRRIGVEEIAARRETSRRRARSLFEEVSAAVGVPVTIEMLAQSAVVDMERIISDFDIVALPAPERAGEWMMLPFAAFAEAALHAKIAALVVPPQVRRRAGPVAALVDRDDDRAIELAGRLARAADENLILLVSNIDDVARDVESLSQRAGVPPQRLRILDVDDADFDVIARTLASVNERVVVLGRKFLPELALDKLLRFAMSRGVPVMTPGEAES